MKVTKIFVTVSNSAVVIKRPTAVKVFITKNI